MNMRFRGTLDELTLLMEKHDVQGRWSEGPHHVHTFRTRDGAVMNWSETKGTIWYQGEAEAALELQAKLVPVFEGRLTRGLRPLF